MYSRFFLYLNVNLNQIILGKTVHVFLVQPATG